MLPFAHCAFPCLLTKFASLRKASGERHQISRFAFSSSTAQTCSESKPLIQKESREPSTTLPADFQDKVNRGCEKRSPTSTFQLFYPWGMIKISGLY